MSKLTAGFKRFIHEEDAPTMVEYGLLVVVIALVVVVGAGLMGGALDTLFGTTATNKINATN